VEQEEPKFILFTVRLQPLVTSEIAATHLGRTMLVATSWKVIVDLVAYIGSILVAY
jgi:hypothetical protein